MTWILITVLLLLLVGGAAEKSNHRAAARVRGSRFYQGGRQRIIDVGAYLRGRPPVYVNGQRTNIKDLSARMAIPRTPKPTREPTAAPIAYTPPTAPTAGPAQNGASGPASPSNGVTVDFFQGLLMLVNAPYEGPNDALRQLRSLAEGGRQWDNGLIRLHQRMADHGDMRIDPFVSDHVVRAAAFGQAMVLELVEADTAMTALLNMTLAEITERGLQVPNTRR